MAMRVTTFRKGQDIGTPYVVTLADKLKANKKLRAAVRESIRAPYQAHANNALKQVEERLRKGAFPGPESSARPVIRAQDADGKAIDAVTPYMTWKPLKFLYRTHAPKSEGFWHKTGKLHGRFKAQSDSGAKVEVKADTAPGRSHHRGMIKLGYKVVVAPADSVAITDVVLKPFVSTSPAVNTVNLPEDFRNTVDVLAMPELGEHRRPFVAQLSAALGRRALTALRRL